MVVLRINEYIYGDNNDVAERYERFMGSHIDTYYVGSTYNELWST